ncbi:proton-conducting transporter membrane subunit [Sporolituus thermophilus]|nr:proton-conducting transporter membrane subunit [Sporolituus thermophilus]
MAALGCTTAVLCAIFVFAGETVVMPLINWSFFGMISARLDRLAAFFLLVVGLVGAMSSLYAVGYCREYYGRRLWIMAAWYNAFLLSIILVFTVSHVVAFLVVWEVMTAVSFFLVNHEWEKEVNRRAAYIYLVMTHIGTAFIITAFLLLAVRAGTFDFAGLAQGGTSETVRNLVFLLALVGFGTKAGIMPVHIWLPLAHPAAPSHVSALMSGVMIKTAIYGLSRFLLDFLGAGPDWWGVLMLVLAAVSAVLGVLYALMENDLKRLLAYSSVENVGIILLGIGAGLLFAGSGQTLLAGLAWSAAFYHLLNHAVFKSLLFLGAGAVVQRTHTKDIERLGGLIRRMPYTAALFLAGAAAISALPFMNGFISEWLTFQALIYLPYSLSGIGGRLAAALFVTALGLTGALAAACFVKAFGVTFLAKPRSAAAGQATEAPAVMLVPMAVLAAGCAVLGLWPQPVLAVLQAMLADYYGASGVAFRYAWPGLAVPVGVAQPVLALPWAAVLLLAGVALALVIFRLRGTPRATVGETWTCGIVPTARMEYTATGFSKPIRTVFAAILQPRRETVAQDDGSAYYGRRLAYRLHIRYVLNDLFYRPVHAVVLSGAQALKNIQSGSLQLYIGYVLAVTVIILVWSTSRW